MIRREATARLESCLGWNVYYFGTYAQREACRLESTYFCKANGLESACGVDGMWGNQIKPREHF
jgi:hypothetical protein